MDSYIIWSKNNSLGTLVDVGLGKIETNQIPENNRIKKIDKSRKNATSTWTTYLKVEY